MIRTYWCQVFRESGVQAFKLATGGAARFSVAIATLIISGLVGYTLAPDDDNNATLIRILGAVIAVAVVIGIVFAVGLIMVPAENDARLKQENARLVATKSKRELVAVMGDLLAQGNQLLRQGQNATVNKYDWVDSLYEWKNKVIQAVRETEVISPFSGWPERAIAKQRPAIYDTYTVFLGSVLVPLQRVHSRLEDEITLDALATCETPSPSA